MQRDCCLWAALRFGYLTHNRVRVKALNYLTGLIHLYRGQRVNLFEVGLRMTYKEIVQIQYEQTACHQQMDALGWVGQRDQMGEPQSVKVKQRDNSDSKESIKTKGKDLYSTLTVHTERRKAFHSILMLFCKMDLMLTL